MQPRKKPSPRGKVDAKRTDEGYLPKVSRSVLRQSLERHPAPHGVWLRQMDLVGGSTSCGVALVHNRFFAISSPHPTRACARPTFPLGEGFEKRRRRSNEPLPVKRTVKKYKVFPVSSHMCCWPLFMRQDRVCALPLGSKHPDYAAPV